MSPVSTAGYVISILAILLAWSGERTTGKLMIYLALLMLHIIASLLYYNYSLTNISDSFGYYYWSYIWAGQPFGLGTIFAEKFVRVLKVDFGGSYADCFIFFQALGFAGLMIVARTLEEIQKKACAPERKAYLGLLFMPSAVFWTSAIGKDAPVFLGVSLSVWSVLNIRRRIIPFCLGIIIVVLFRAHIALIAAAAFAAAAMFGSGISTGRRLGLFGFGLIALWFGIAAVRSEFGINVTDTASVAAFMDKQNDVYAGVAGTTSLGDAPYPVRVLSLLFRPFFFDATGGMAMIASLENVAVLIVFFYMLAHWRDILFLAKRVFFIRFILAYGFLILFSLTLVYYNVGLGLRQRMMAYPMVASLLVSLLALRGMRTVSQPERPRPGLLERDNRNRTAPGL